MVIYKKKFDPNKSLLQNLQELPKVSDWKIPRRTPQEVWDGMVAEFTPTVIHAGVDLANENNRDVTITAQGRTVSYIALEFRREKK